MGQLSSMSSEFHQTFQRILAFRAELAAKLAANPELGEEGKSEIFGQVLRHCQVLKACQISIDGRPFESTKRVFITDGKASTKRRLSCSIDVALH